VGRNFDPAIRARVREAITGRGLPDDAAAAFCGLSRSRIGHYRKDLHLPRNPKPRGKVPRPEMDRAVRQCVRFNGMSDAETADVLGVTRGRVAQVRKRLGLSCNRKYHTGKPRLDDDPTPDWPRTSSLPESAVNAMYARLGRRYDGRPIDNPPAPRPQSAPSVVG
jgi:hypothetical protein